MVRLKDAFLNSNFTKITIFQFLMVRLKERAFFEGWDKEEISIPYGAIKSSAQFGRVYGGNKFQFLMVRLKENSMRLLQNFKAISIPYGAIKRGFR